MTQTDLFQGDPREKPDSPRLAKQLSEVRTALIVYSAGRWTTLREIARFAGCEPQSASARLRELRNKHGWKIERKRIEGTVYYRATPP